VRLCSFPDYPPPSYATLIGVLPATPGGTDYQAYYDDVADLTWLANANAAGMEMDWTTANAWAAGLDIDGVTGWRLPASVPCIGFSCTGSEMGNVLCRTRKYSGFIK
jgi:hypothetical protein